MKKNKVINGAITTLVGMKILSDTNKEKTLKDYKEILIKKIKESDTTEELVFELKKFTKGLIRFHLGGDFSPRKSTPRIREV